MRHKLFILLFAIAGISFKTMFWGFSAHQQINRLAVFTLPPEMMIFYKKHIDYLTENAVNPDKRRYAVVGEAPRHYIDLDVYGDSAAYKLPRRWDDAVKQIGEDSLQKHGIVPWFLPLIKAQLTAAFKEKNASKILRLSADLGHYAGDANVPLHTTRNYNGQLTGQEGIHGFWETRLPEMFSADYDFFVGKAEYLPSVSKAAWRAVTVANAAKDSVLNFERKLTEEIGITKKYVLDDRNGIIQKTYSAQFSQRYHQMLKGQVERQMQASIKLTADLWFTAWVDAGQPDLKPLLDYQPSEVEKKEDEKEKLNWLQRLFNVRNEGN
jgi:hypothetical protein